MIGLKQIEFFDHTRIAPRALVLLPGRVGMRRSRVVQGLPPGVERKPVGIHTLIAGSAWLAHFNIVDRVDLPK